MKHATLIQPEGGTVENPTRVSVYDIDIPSFKIIHVMRFSSWKAALDATGGSRNCSAYVSMQIGKELKIGDRRSIPAIGFCN